MKSTKTSLPCTCSSPREAAFGCPYHSGKRLPLKESQARIKAIIDAHKTRKR